LRKSPRTPWRIQPIAAADVAASIVRVAQAEPINGVVNIGGPEKLRFADMADLVVAHRGGSLPVVVDPSARYFGTLVGGDQPGHR
jgi:uncharacterized protein YbjT (DUF2867 family)